MITAEIQKRDAQLTLVIKTMILQRRDHGREEAGLGLERPEVGRPLLFLLGRHLDCVYQKEVSGEIQKGDSSRPDGK